MAEKDTATAAQAAAGVFFFGRIFDFRTPVQTSGQSWSRVAHMLSTRWQERTSMFRQTLTNTQVSWPHGMMAKQVLDRIVTALKII